ncbi:family 65 glycosyl hydrolase domain-containing protein [uncultured Acetobacteroides sp.]|uniref:family 65 glycosyl hydrolase domain-containing protein n=1 Tax=uncultured Acetobacteroides sp. TaxID=1760811 RepID=UPI0029F5B0B3|nr:family 65 glycosyl hydrolase domain-containing protein [uncultured Acetobacteroides sp.]
MNNYKVDEWKIIEEAFDPQRVEGSESIFSIGNGMMGQRANFEEDYSGEMLRGSYIAGVYYPDKTRVGWWKNGYPEYFAKVLNSANFIGIRVKVDGESIDLSQNKVVSFSRVLDMQHGLLQRNFVVELGDGSKVEVVAERFMSMARPEVAAISYSVRLLDGDATIAVESYLDGDVVNEDSNYNEKFWDEVAKTSASNGGYLVMKTKKLSFNVCWNMGVTYAIDSALVQAKAISTEREKYVSSSADLKLVKGQTLTVNKYVAVASTLNHPFELLVPTSDGILSKAVADGYAVLKGEHTSKWLEKWQHADIVIEGDAEAQQGIRFNIFQLFQTYTGEDERLNIGPKGFTGEKYGGSTYWDTEAYCLPFYMSTAGERVARQLLIYRYRQLDKAIENAAKLGFTNGAALFPMVTMNGEECHNEWEITFEEIHRNGAIAYAIKRYIDYTGDKGYLAEYGLEVLVGIARFWAQRITWSDERQKYVMLGVTGPNEYENNVNNNWYTNYLATWTLRYAAEAVGYVKQANAARWTAIEGKIAFNSDAELGKWADIVEKIHLPYNEKLGVIMQQDGFMDKEQILVKDLNPSQRPLNQKWSWDRILRSVFIKQADVLQGIYFFENDFDLETIRKNFDFYEQRTVHESSLSPCVHSILACKIGDMDRAKAMYLRTSRLDLDDYNKEVNEGLHITSMAGSWMSVVEGFGGLRIKNDTLYFNPFIPENWKSLAFKVIFRGRTIKAKFEGGKTILTNESGQPLTVMVKDEAVCIPAGSTVVA